MKHFIIFACLLGVSVALQADVDYPNSRGFVSKKRISISASPEMVWRGLTKDISHWWDPAHTYTGDAANMLMQTKVGGCLCEVLEKKKKPFEHLRVIVVRKNSELRLRGGLGPLREIGAAGTMNFRLVPYADMTRLDYKYAVSGAGSKELADAVDKVMLGQLDRLKKYLEGN